MKKNGHKILVAILVCFALTSLLGCGNSSQQSTVPTQTGTATATAMSTAPKESTLPQENKDTQSPVNLNDTQELVLGSVRDIIPGDGDAYYVSLSADVWEPLTRDVEGVIKPGLAESWEHNENCTEWTIHLRKDVSFHNGEKFNADIVLANIERYKKGPMTSTYVSIDIEKTFPGLKSAEKLDDYTVKLGFSDPVPTLEYMMSDYGTPMYHPNCFDAQTGAVTSFVIGTGRYKIKEHVADQYAVFERNDDYYGDYKPYIKTIRVKCIPDADARYAALKSEEVMALIDNGAILTAQVDELMATDDRFNVVMSKSHMTHYLKVNGEKFPFNDVRIRQAVSYAIDRATINETLWGGLCMPAYNILSYRTPFYKEIGGEYSMEKAKTLVDEVLKGERVSVDMIISSSRAASYPYKSEAEYLQSEFKKIGIDVNIQILDSSIYNEKRKNGEFHCTLDAHGFNNADPYSNLFGYIGTEGGSNVSYHFGYSNSEIDGYLAEAKVSSDETKRKELYNKIQDIAAVELPMIPILYDVNVNVHNKKITGYKTVEGIGWPTIQWA